MNRKIILSVLLGSTLMLTTGCSNKNLLMPGQEKSDCELNSGQHGVCGSPGSIYKAKDEIDGLGKGTDQAYFVHDDGTIQEIDNGELGAVVEVKTLPNGKKVAIKKGEGGEEIIKPISNGSVVLKNNSYLMGEEEDTVMIRNQEVIREAWINTYTDPYGNLALEHRIMIVTKEAGWAIGEETPRNVKKTRFIPSLISKEVLTSSSKASNAIDDKKLHQYDAGVAETPKEDKKLKSYLKGM